jgi:dipeptidyl aminopeptidase/acylaminoacyl peptidase
VKLTHSRRIAAFSIALSGLAPVSLDAQGFALPQILGFTYPDNLVAAPAGQRIAYTIQQRGQRRIWVADGPDWKPRRLASYPDDGQEITSLQFAGNDRLIYARGGDHGSNFPAANNLIPNPTSSPIEPKLEIWALSVSGGGGGGGGQPVKLADGDDPVASPNGDRVVFQKGRELWVVPADASQPAKRVFFARGTSEAPVWSPDGGKLAFVSNRGDHSFIAVYASDSVPLQYLGPSSNLDAMPRWSPDGSRIAFVRRAGRGGAEPPPLEQQPLPWSIWVGEVATGSARPVWKSPETLWGSVPRTLGGPNLRWAAGDRLVFLSDVDGWPHLYSVPVAGGDALLLTPGNFMVEYVTLTPDNRYLIYNANTGPDQDDSERRHLYRVPVDQAKPVALTTGGTIEWAPVVTADGSTVAYLGADPRNPPLPYLRTLSGGQPKALNGDLVSADFPAARLVTPEHVTWKSPDGLTIHGQLFKNPDGGGRGQTIPDARRPAIVFVHGGPPRQMLLGWHYMFYYSNSYAMNQYLASKGYVVLSVNYRLGIGYGHDFHNPPHAGARGAAEYQDVLAGGKYLQTRPDVDPARVGIWGGSYGGFLTAMALGQNSEVFAAGVDFHGVHDRTSAPSDRMQIAAMVGDGIGSADVHGLIQTEWASSPDSYISRWKSPVLLIHGDDDRNVRVEQSVDLAQRLRKQGVSFEEMIIPDEIHDFLLYRNWVKGDSATVAFFEKTLKNRRPAATQDGR